MNRRGLLALALALVWLIGGLAALSLVAQEIVTLSVAETKPSNANYRVASFVMDVDAGLLSITLKGVDDVAYPPVSCTYASNTTPTGASLILGLNKANLSSAYAANATTGSLKQRIFHRLVVMGESTAVCGKTLTGTLAGSVP
jgi:hypothetical protein